MAWRNLSANCAPKHQLTRRHKGTKRNSNKTVAFCDASEKRFRIRPIGAGIFNVKNLLLSVSVNLIFCIRENGTSTGDKVVKHIVILIFTSTRSTISGALKGAYARLTLQATRSHKEGNFPCPTPIIGSRRLRPSALAFSRRSDYSYNRCPPFPHRLVTRSIIRRRTCREAQRSAWERAPLEIATGQLPILPTANSSP